MEEKKFFGFYRAQVVEVDVDRNMYGAVRVFIPDLMEPETMKKGDRSFSENRSGIIAYPANNPLGGYNLQNPESYYCTTVYVPPKGSWVWVFFEGGDISKPFYFGAFKYQHAPLPPENIGAVLPHKVYTIIRSGDGRSIIVSDSPERPRVEISGKRRKMKSVPLVGSPEAVSTIQDNMTVIMIDETPGGEQVLIQTYKGDMIKISVEERKLDIVFKGDVTITTQSNINMNAAGDVNVSAGGNLNVECCSLNLTTKCPSKTSNLSFGSNTVMTIDGNVKMDIIGEADLYVQGNANVLGTGEYRIETIRTGDLKYERMTQAPFFATRSGDEEL